MIERRSKATKIGLLVLALFIGPVQAQSVFKCAMMDEVVYGDCCCPTNRTTDDCENADRDAPANRTLEQCCDQSIELSFNPDAQDEWRVAKPFDLRTGLDPPPAVVCSITLDLPAPRRSAIAIPFLYSDAHLIRSDTYLITQRLRI